VYEDKGYPRFGKCFFADGDRALTSKDRIVTCRFAIKEKNLHELYTAAVFGDNAFELGHLTLCPLFGIIGAHSIQMTSLPGKNAKEAVQKTVLKRVCGMRSCPYCCIQQRPCQCPQKERFKAFSQYALGAAHASAQDLLVAMDLAGISSESSATDSYCSSLDAPLTPGSRKDAFAEFLKSMKGATISSRAFGPITGFTTLHNFSVAQWRAEPAIYRLGNQIPSISELTMAYLSRYSGSHFQPRRDMLLQHETQKRLGLGVDSGRIHKSQQESTKSVLAVARRHHPEVPRKARSRSHVCPECSLAFTQRCHLAAHVDVIHKKLRSFACQSCDKTFGTQANLTRHTRTVHERKVRFLCDLCNFASHEAFDLRRHRKVHGDAASGRRG